MNPNWRKRASIVAFIGIVATLIVAMGMFSLFVVNWLATEATYYIVQTVDQARAGTSVTPATESVISVVWPTPTPVPKLPLVGSEECQIGMVCAIPTEVPGDCKVVTYGKCTFTGYLGENQEMATPVPWSLTGH